MTFYSRCSNQPFCRVSLARPWPRILLILIALKPEWHSVNVSYPVYPPVARAAHITGDVDVMIGVRKDGSIESAVVVSGPLLLRPAALDSVQGSRFECRNCGEAINNYRLVYTFKLEDDCSCGPRMAIPTSRTNLTPR